MGIFLILLQLYGENALKPNHHYAVHIIDQIQDYGPVYNFWSFLSERLNKILKNMNSNNKVAGELEVSMMREFSRYTKMNYLVHFTALVIFLHLLLSSFMQ
jgi:hypothetical protein